jgi:SAM-dependent methyltransferase
MRYELPDRYHEYTSLQERLWRELPPLQAGQRILDIGAGRLPTIPVANRPSDLHYVGLDVSGEELRAATPGAYDEILVSDIGVHRERVAGNFDLAVSLNTLEHVTDLETAVNVIGGYLRPEGHLVALFAGKHALHAILNRMLPEVVGRALINRPAETKFPAVYDHCTYRGLRRLLADWHDVAITPLFLGANYLRRAPLLQSLFVSYENWAARADRADLASHYIVSARTAVVTSGTVPRSPIAQASASRADR